jgi:hypothetical protein
MPGPIVLNGNPTPDTLVVVASSPDDGFYQLNGALQSFTDATQFTFNGLAGDDSFTIANPAGGLFAPIGGITFIGGGDAGDTLNNLGGTATSGSFTLSSSTSGTLAHTGGTQTINVSNLAATSLITDTVRENFFKWVGTAAAETISVTDGGLVGGVQTTQIGGPSFADIRFANASGLMIDGGGGGDALSLDYAGLAPAGFFGIKNVGAVTQSAAFTASNLVIAPVAGPVTLGGSNDVSNLGATLTGAGEAFTFNDVADLTVTFVSIPGFGSADGVTTNNGNIALTTQDGALNIHRPVSAGTATASLTAGSVGSADRALTLNSPVSGTGGVTLTGDNISVTGGGGGGVNAGTGTATLQPFQDGTLINLGGPDAANTLGLTDGELDNVTAGVVRVGNADAGSISITDAISPFATNQLELVTGASILDMHGGPDLTVTRLGMVAGDGIGVSETVETAVSNLEATTDTGGIAILNAGPLTIGGVNSTLAGISVATSGDISISANGTITLADTDGFENVRGGSISGNVNLTAATGTSDVRSTVDADAITAPGGDITVIAGRDILFGTGGTDFDNDVRASGSIVFNAAQDITIDGFSDIASDDFGLNSGGGVVFQAGRNINFTANFGDDASVGANGNAGGDVLLITGANGILTLSAPFSDAVFSTSGGVSLLPIASSSILPQESQPPWKASRSYRAVVRPGR